MRLLILATCFLVFPVSSQSQNHIQKSGARTTESSCERNPNVVAKCFLVHGRLSFYNGTPSARIWKIGTKHILGIHSDVLPGELGLKMTSFDTEAFGDFRVCPFTKEKSGEMQFVCIASAENVKYKKRN